MYMCLCTYVYVILYYKYVLYMKYRIGEIVQCVTHLLACIWLTLGMLYVPLGDLHEHRTRSNP